MVVLSVGVAVALVVALGGLLARPLSAVAEEDYAAVIAGCMKCANADTCLPENQPCAGRTQANCEALEEDTRNYTSEYTGNNDYSCVSADPPYGECTLGEDALCIKYLHCLWKHETAQCVKGAQADRDPINTPDGCTDADGKHT